MRLDGRAENLEDFLASHKPGQWFTWSDTTNKTYANIVVLDGSKKPTEAKCTAGLKALQDEWDLENNSYKSKRRAQYNSFADQLDALYKDLVAGKLDATGTWATHIAKVKSDNPKP
jgi:hypothetical protein